MKIKHIMTGVFLLVLLAANFSFSEAKISSDNDVLNIEENQSSCYPLDIVFIVDQSQSMGFMFSPTDPTNQRETAVEAMIDWLAENVLDRCPNVRHQVGVVSYGTQARIDMPLTDISPDTFEEYLGLTGRLHENIQADNLGGANVLQGFKQASKLFKESALATDSSRKRVIVLLTDGPIHTGEVDDRSYGLRVKELGDYIKATFPFDATLKQRENCLAFLDYDYGSLENAPYEKKNECLQYEPPSTAYNNSTFIFIVLLNFGQGYPIEIKKGYENIAETNAGELLDFYSQGLENRNEIPAYFQKVLSRLVGIPSGVKDCGAIAVNPYMERATFVFYKYSPDTVVNIRYKDTEGVTHQVAGGESNTGSFTIKEYYTYGTNERYVFDNPYPGIWFVESDKCADGGVSIFYQEVQVNPGGFDLAMPIMPKMDLEPFYDPSDPYYLTYQMLDSSGEIVENSDNPLFAVDLKVDVTAPNGETYNYPMQWDNTSKQFKASSPLQIPIEGTYRVNFIGSTWMYTNTSQEVTESFSEVFTENVELFRHENLEFKVRDVEPFIFSIDTPTQGLVLPQIHDSIFRGWPLRIKPIQVQVTVSGRNNAELVIPIQDLLTDPTNTLTAWIILPDGSQTAPITLQPKTGSPNTFTGEFDDIDTTGPLELHVKLTGEYNADYHPDKKEQSVVFSRTDSSVLGRAGFYSLLLILLIILIALIVLYQIWLHQDPVQGEVQIFKNGTNIGSLDLFSNKRITTLKGSHLSDYHIKKLVARFNAKQKKSTLEEDPSLKEPRGIHLRIRCGCNKSADSEVLPGDELSYCAETEDQYSIIFNSEENS